MNYERIYNQLIKRGVDRKEILDYKESHHIVPRCIGGGDEASNLVDLTAREHFIAHRLLTKMYPDNRDLLLAVNFLAGARERSGLEYNSRGYEANKKELVRVLKESKIREGSYGFSLIVKVPCDVSNVTKPLLSKIKGIHRKTKVSDFNKVFTNVLGAGGIHYSKNTSRSIVFDVKRGNGRWVKGIPVRRFWNATAHLERLGYVRTEVCPISTPVANRKKSAVFATDKMYEDFGHLEDLCRSAYQETLYETYYRCKKTGKKGFGMHTEIW